MTTEPDYAAYWAAALKRHKALIAAGCISPVAAKRVAPGKAKDAREDAEIEQAER